MKTLPTANEMQRASQTRDASYDGIFFLGVRTTGVFCRPSCPARKPLPENARYFPSVSKALFAGYRPCKRCRPLDTGGRPPDWIARLLAGVEKNPTQRFTDTELRSAGIDPVRTRRYFLKHYGMTFQAFCRARRMREALDDLRRGTDLDDVALGHGYESHSGFRDAFVKTFGRPPGHSRNADCVVVSWLESPLGPLIVGATSEGVCIVEFSDRRMLEGQFAALRKLFSSAIVPGENEHIAQAKRELTDYFAGKLTRFTVPLIYPGTDFQRRVWSALLRIPYGETRSYEDIAIELGVPGSQRAVGHANGLNRIAILIPCHRVVNKDGKLGGYGGGLWRKRFLLDLEQRNKSPVAEASASAEAYASATG
jgi:AraC family transcriptional regulator of adaptative response/methylated-DNA-[protein]-cysteine methyltransferase